MTQGSASDHSVSLNIKRKSKKSYSECRANMISSLSEYIQCVPIYLLFQQLVHIAMFSDNIHRAAKQFLQELFQGYEHIDIRFHLHTDIHIAIRTLFVSGYGTKDTHRADSELLLQNRHVLFKQFYVFTFCSHDVLLPQI